MSVIAEIDELESLEEIKIKGDLSIESIVRRQIDRCNMTISSADTEIFNANVRALMKHLPKNKNTEVMARGKEYNVTSKGLVYPLETCGVKAGTPKNPVVSVPGHPDWNFLMDIPKPYREAHMDEIDILSPVEVSSTETDYEKLYEVILQTYEGVGLTWNVEYRIVEMGKVKRETIPQWLINEAKDMVVKVLITAREEDKKFNDVTYNEIVEEMRKLTPPTRVV